MQNLVILEENLDENYQPTREEILEYAMFIGMSPRSDQRFFYIAEEALKTPLPYPWKPAETSNGDIFYMNTQTKEITEEHPLDAIFKRKFIEAKKKERNEQGSKSKTAMKLQNLIKVNRDPEEKDLSVSNLLQNNDSYFKEQLHEELKEQENFLIKYEKEQLLEFEKFQEQKQKEYEEQIKDLKGQEQNSDWIKEKAQTMRNEYKAKKEQIKEKINQEFEVKTENHLKQVKEDIETNLNKIKEEKNEQFNLYFQLYNQKFKEKIETINKSIQQLQDQLMEKQKLIQEALTTNKLQEKFSRVEDQLKQQIQQQHKRELDKINQQFEQEKQRVLSQLQQERLKSRYNLQQEYQQDKGLKQRAQLRMLYKERLELKKLEVEQENYSLLNDEKIRLEKQLYDDLNTYEENVRALRIELKQNKINKDKFNLTKFYKEQLTQYKYDQLKQQEIEYQKHDLQLSIKMNESFINQKPLQPFEINSDLIALKVSLENQIRQTTTKTKFIRQEIDKLTEQLNEMEFLYQLDKRVDKKQYLEAVLAKKEQQLAKLQKLHIDEDKQNKQIYFDEQVNQIENEKNWVEVKKQKLKHDKKRVNKIYQALSKNQVDKRQIDIYNQSVEQLRYVQQLLQNSEYIIKYFQINISKLETNLKQYYQTRSNQYLKDNDQLYKDLQNFKGYVEQQQELPIEKEYPVSRQRSMTFTTEQSKNQIQNIITNQKLLLKDMKDNVKYLQTQAKLIHASKVKFLIFINIKQIKNQKKVPSPGIEPGLFRPQRKVLTTIR